MANLLSGMQIAYRLFLLMLIEIFRGLLFFFELQADTSCQLIFSCRLPSTPFFPSGFVIDRFVQSQCLPVNSVWIALGLPCSVV